MTMRSTCLVLCLGLLAALPPVAWSQTAEIQLKVDKKLEDLREEDRLTRLLEQAIKNNPDIRVAEVKLQEAEAELNRARMAAMHKIVVLQSQLRSARAELTEAEKSYKRAKELNHAISAAELAQAALALMSAKEKVTRFEAEQPYLLGKAPAASAMTGIAFVPSGDFVYRQATGGSGMGSTATGAGTTAIWTDHYAVLQTLPQAKTEKLRELLKSPVKWPTGGTAALRNVVDQLRAFTPSFSFEIMTSADFGGPKELPGPMFAGELPLHAVIQWIEDRYEVKFVVRDYGIVVTDRGRLPPGAVALLDLVREPQPHPETLSIRKIEKAP
jgi:hypothetical protein